jgi:hypothetical protein
MTYRITVFLLTLAFSSASFADNGVYLGAAWGNVDPDFEKTLAGLPPGTQGGSDSGYKLIAGIRPLNALAFEANYTSLGDHSALFDNIACTAVVGTNCPLSVKTDTTSLSASAIGIIALPMVDLYVRGGFVRWDLDEEVTLASVTSNLTTLRSDNGFDPVYGLGGQLKLGSFAVRAEFERFDVGDNPTDVFSIGLTYTLF